MPTHSAAGTYIQSLAGYRTFIPHDLPPGLALSPRVTRLVEDATHLLGKVEMCRTLLPNAELLVYSSLQREAIASSTIEGTIASPEELVLFQVSQQSERASVREVANYAAALGAGCEQIKKLPVINENLVLRLHSDLLAGVRGYVGAGRFKVGQNAIGSSTDSIENAAFVPPPPERTQELMASLLQYLNDEGNRDARVVQCALVHYQFETIHPFSDGNGRVGRLVIILQMILLGLLSAPLIYPSVYFERRRQEYYNHLQAVRERSEWDEWIGFFAEGVIKQCGDTMEFTQTVLNLKERIHQELDNVRSRATVLSVLDAFFVHPIQSITSISGRSRISYNAVAGALSILENLGIVREITGRAKGRVYLCRPVHAAIFGGEG